MITYLDRHGTIRDAASDGPQSGIVSIHAVVLSSIPEGPGLPLRLHAGYVSMA